MTKRYFDLRVDAYVPGRWYLSEPTNLAGEEVDDIWAFIQGRPVEINERLRIPIFRPGKPLDIDFAGAGQTPIVSARVASVFREIAANDVQLFPVEVEGQSEPYFLLNVAREVRCIDDAACREVQFFSADEELHTDRAGQYRSVIGLRIDKSKVVDERVFRLWGYHVALIVDAEIKEALERAGITGGRFEEV
jgi:hypothetical protein